MSIKYNGKLIAGKYKTQIVTDATESNKGLIRIATLEEVNTGTDNTTAVTPKDLATKQDTLTAGTGIEILPDGTINNTQTSVEWGNIQGDIINQSDLIDKFDKKQDVISDLENIRDGANKGSTSVQPSDLAIVATSGSYNDLLNKPIIPDAVTETTISGWGFTKNTGTVTSVTINGIAKNPADGVVDLGTVITAHQDISGKQDVISDLATIREGASKGATALQSVPDEYVTETELNAKGYLTSYTETDPIYTADKPNIANTSLDNLSEAGEKHFLNKSQITNCLLEVPQRIKLELNDGVLTLKAGSVVIVPYGVEDLTAQYPNGATFLHENYKVYDTQFEDGKFFVWVEIQNDTPCACGNPGTRLVFVGRDGSGYDSNSSLVISGPTPSKETENTRWYDTSANLIKEYISSEWVLAENYLSFPFAIAIADDNKIFTSIDQVFNGMGYIGSTVWVDKGVKGLAPNGRNEDGSLNNTEIITTGVKTRALNTNSSGDYYVAFTQGITWTSVGTYSYDEEKNMTLSGGADWSACVFGRMQFTNGVITSFQPKQPFRAVDYNDIVEKRNNLTQTNISLSSGTISLNTSSDYYSITPTSNTTFTFNNVPSGVCTFELRVKLSTVYTLTFPSSVKWMNSTPPDMSETGIYFLVFRTEDNGTTWYANCQGKWSI